jgi:DNA-directed RNA polymerase subunit M/transcription elongation factor TFIIS
LKEFNKTPSILNDEHYKLAQTLLSLHKMKNPFLFVPNYHYDELGKRVYCKVCGSFLISVKNIFVVCGNCGGLEKTDEAILRHTKEFKLLFPDLKITTDSIFNWCKIDINKKTIRRVLKKNYNALGKTSSTYYQ